MKKILCLMLSVFLLASVMAGCRRTDSGDTTGSTDASTQNTAPSTDPSTEPSTDPSKDSSQPDGNASNETVSILSAIWDEFEEDQRFASYGGTIENAVDNAPGPLDLSYTEEILSKYLLPQQHLEKVQEAASLVHMMNSNIFTAVAFRLEDDQEVATVGEDLYQNVLSTQWICGSPDRLIIASVDGNTLLMAFGSVDAMTLFGEKLNTVYPNAKILQDASIAG